MAERFSEMENSSVPSKATLEERLKEYPKLKAKIETMLGIIENACAKDKSAWRKEKQDWLKDNRWPEVLESLRPFLEEAGIPDPQAPVRACFRYLSNRTPFLDYKGALAAGLPIGSGEIEGAHRYVFQKWLKLSGAWWKTENLKKVIALRVLRANRRSEDYWNNLHQEAA